MATGRVTQQAAEAIVSGGSQIEARVAQQVVEAIIPVIAYSPTWAAANGVSLSFPGADTSLDAAVVQASVSKRNRLSPFFRPQAGTAVVVHVGATGAMNDGGNVGVICVDGTDDHSQASPANNGNYTLSPTLADGKRTYFVYSFLSSNYRSGLTGTMTYDSTVVSVTGAAVTQEVTEALLLASSPEVRVTQQIVEAVILDQTAINPGGVSTVSHGYAV